MEGIANGSNSNMPFAGSCLCISSIVLCFLGQSTHTLQPVSAGFASFCATPRCSLWCPLRMQSEPYSCKTELQALTAYLKIPDWPHQPGSFFAHITAGLRAHRTQLAHLVGSHQWETNSQILYGVPSPST